MRVLDVCCGAGAATIPAAEAVGASGSVLGVDLAENLLELGRRKAANGGLANVEFRAGDLRDLRLPEATFDAVICAFGIFFVPDMEARSERCGALSLLVGSSEYRPGGPASLNR